MHRWILLTFLLVSSTGIAQELHSVFVDELDKSLSQKDASSKGKTQTQLENCRDYATELKQWVNQNYPMWMELDEQNQQLRARNEELSRQMEAEKILPFLLVGVGIFVGWMLIKGVRRFFFPLTKTRKVLGVLLLIAAWVTVAAVVGMSDESLIHHPINLLSSVFVYSIPALTFGGIGVWWFGRTKPEVLW